ncbi:MAG: DUF1467 domain-containing protein [Pelagerythrobacter marensis]|uniref:DUF1467 family protein n=1 Tax=Qipengyuania sp. YIM B01966 TaxID=2778646 RepID=UPI000DB832C2|nr:DUF1467 family protein [Qipengyuania sp. YIM B01966]PZO72514.1 MAG: DUF1467 domain-containing protein [Pelagerythrobacter marensis]
MHWTSIIAIYVLFWVGTAFVMLPFGVRTHDEMGVPKVPGQADSAPANFRPGRIIIRASIGAALLTALYVANYVNGWIEADDLNVFGTPPSAAAYPD